MISVKKTPERDRVREHPSSRKAASSKLFNETAPKVHQYKNVEIPDCYVVVENLNVPIGYETIRIVRRHDRAEMSQNTRLLVDLLGDGCLEIPLASCTAGNLNSATSRNASDATSSPGLDREQRMSGRGTQDFKNKTFSLSSTSSKLPSPAITLSRARAIRKLLSIKAPKGELKRRSSRSTNISHQLRNSAYTITSGDIKSNTEAL